MEKETNYDAVKDAWTTLRHEGIVSNGVYEEIIDGCNGAIFIKKLKKELEDPNIDWGDVEDFVSESVVRGKTPVHNICKEGDRH